jgi:hypothetical protein
MTMACGCKGKTVSRYAGPIPADAPRQRAGDPITAAASVGEYTVVNSAGRKVRSFGSLPKAEVYARRIGGTVLPGS